MINGRDHSVKQFGRKDGGESNGSELKSGPSDLRDQRPGLKDEKAMLAEGAVWQKIGSGFRVVFGWFMILVEKTRYRSTFDMLIYKTAYFA